MYTQCPECGVAFRVTAEVLKQAAGKVRCGGCGIAFNALAHLSEKRPAAPRRSQSASNPGVPELKADGVGELEADTPPQTISAEQSAALLKTLDQLAGSDIRIEDTGVEWRVLDEDEDETDDEPPVEATDTPAEVVEEMRFDDNTPLPDDFDFASQPATPPPTAVVEPEPIDEPKEAQVDLAFGDPDEWQDLLGDIDQPEAIEEADDIAEADDPEEAQDAEEAEPTADGEDDGPSDKPLDMDTQFAIQAEAMGIDLSGMHEMADDDQAEPEAGEELELEDESADDDHAETSIDEDLIAAAFENEAAGLVEEDETDEPSQGDEDSEEEEEIELDLEEITDFDDETEDEVEDIVAEFDNAVEGVIETIVAELDGDDANDDASDDASDEHVIPEMSEEEKTINMMIDQELLNVAVEDEDGFASTIVQRQPDKKVDKEIESEKEKVKDEKPKVEAIVMEGEFVRGALDKEKLAADEEAKSRRFDDPGASFKLGKAKDDYDKRRRHYSSPAGTGTIAGIVVLALGLLLQVVHQSREALATVPAFNKAVGPVYRMLGKPLTPTWDISGWRFEATKGSTETIGAADNGDDAGTAAETEEVLTIYSRVGNKSDKELPYPLVHLSLTDRFEEIIGSRVLDPGEYLAENADPRKLVPPGNTFNAVISIESAAEEATGFKLNVCYRLASGQLRCAIEDFK